MTFAAERVCAVAMDLVVCGGCACTNGEDDDIEAAFPPGETFIAGRPDDFAEPQLIPLPISLSFVSHSDSRGGVKEWTMMAIPDGGADSKPRRAGGVADSDTERPSRRQRCTACLVS